MHALVVGLECKFIGAALLTPLEPHALRRG